MSNQIQHKDDTKVPEPTLCRSPWCLSNVKLLKQKDGHYVSSVQISKEINIDASQIAKDLSYVNIPDRARVDYEMDMLIAVLEDFLGLTNMHKAFLFGVGSLGGALLRNSGPSHFDLETMAVFDVSPTLADTTPNGIPTFHSDNSQERMKEHGVHIGMLTVSVEIAQCIMDTMIAGDIKTVWNFTPFRIHVPEDIMAQNMSFYAHLAIMFNCLNSNETEQTMKIITVGTDYTRYNKELGYTLENKGPVTLTKPDLATFKGGEPFLIPDPLNEVHYEAELVAHTNRLGKNIAPCFARRYYDALAVDIDFTARDLQRQSRAAGDPQGLCKGFDSSAAIGTFVPIKRPADVWDPRFHLDIDRNTVQQGDTADMLFKIDGIIVHVSHFVILKVDGLLFTGTPVGVGPASVGQHLGGYLEAEKLLDFYIR